MSDTLISVIIPIYNVSKYLRQALDSLAVQKMKKVEFICVDDCSTDESPEIIREYMEKDDRFKGVFLEKNSACTKARKEGVLAAKGKYIMFLDGDDYFAPDACEEAYRAIEEKDVDILQFGTNVILEDELKENLPGLEELLRAPDETIRADGGEFLSMVFEKRRWASNMWNKIYKREVCVSAYSEIGDDYIQNGEDVYAYFLITYFSSSYAGAPGLNLYNYCYGRGFYGNRTIELRKFRQYCDLAKVTRLLRAFLEKHDISDEYGHIVKLIDKRFYEGTVHNWRESLKSSLTGEGFDMMCEAWDVETIVATIAKQCWRDKPKALSALYDSALIRRKPGKIRTIGIYYHWMKLGGVERVISTLSYKWSKMGYNIVLITDTEPTEQDFPVAPGVKRVVISDFRNITSNNYIDRARSLAEVLRKNDIDLVDYNAWVCPLMVWDLILIKSLGVAFNFHMHSVGAFGMQFGDHSINDRMAAGPIMDSIAALSRVDELLYRCCNPNTYYISNPLDCDEISARPVAPLKGHTILWCGRFSLEKQPMDAVRMFAEVHEKIPDARLIMVGSGDSGIMASVSRFIAENGLSGCVSLPGYSANVEEYYLKSDVLISTSAYEGFPMVYLEAASYGLPIVAYALDYLEMVRSCGSVVSVPKGNHQALADAVIGILQDDEGRAETGRKIRSEVMAFAGEDVDSKWKTVFDSIESGSSPEPVDETQRILVDTMLYYYSMGISRLRGESEQEESAGQGSYSGGIVPVKMGGTGATDPMKASGKLSTLYLGKASSLAGDTDLNKVLTPGTYMFVNNGKDSVIHNSPAMGTYKLIVDQIVTGSTRQTIMAASSLNSYVRVYTRKQWSQWHNNSGVDLKADLGEVKSRVDVLDGYLIIRMERFARRVVRKLIRLVKGNK